MESDTSSPSSPTHRSRQASRSSSTTIASSSTSISTFDLPHELDPQEDDDRDRVEIAGIDRAFEDLDIAKETERGADEHEGEVRGSKDIRVGEQAVQDDDEVEGSEETLDEAGQDTIHQEEGQGEGGDDDDDDDENAVEDEQDDGDGEMDENHPVYQYTLALFEYTKKQYLEARWQHEKLERDQYRRGKQSGMERMAARKAAMSSKHDRGI